MRPAVEEVVDEFLVSEFLDFFNFGSVWPESVFMRAVSFDFDFVSDFRKHSASLIIGSA